MLFIVQHKKHFINTYLSMLQSKSPFIFIKTSKYIYQCCQLAVEFQEFYGPYKVLDLF